MSNRRKATPAELEFITAAREGDRDRLHDALVEIQRDPKRWFCSATDAREYRGPRQSASGLSSNL
jgi:hypothetical protein